MRKDMQIIGAQIYFVFVFVGGILFLYFNLFNSFI